MVDVLLLRNAPTEFRADSAIPLNVEAIGERIARLLGGRLVERRDGSSTPSFVVAFVPITSDLAAEMGVTGDGDIYGGVVEHAMHADKAILHPLVGPDAVRPEWYSPAFASSVAGVTLPGFTAFSRRT